MPFLKQNFRPIMSMTSTVASTSASVANSTLDYRVYGENFDCTIIASTGNFWIDPTTTATTNSFPLSEGDSIDLQVPKTLYTIADSTTAKFSAIIWG
jgi:hypothetical protein